MLKKSRLLRLPDRWKKPLKCAAATSADVAKTTLVTLERSADAFPPLKSAVGGVLAVWGAAERVKSSKKNAQAVAARCREVLDVLLEVVPDHSNIPPEMLISIDKFTILLKDIQEAIESLQKRRGIDSLLHLNRSEGQLLGFGQRLDNACRCFTMSGTLRTEVKLSEMQRGVSDMSTKLEIIDRTESKLSDVQCEVANAKLEVIDRTVTKLSEIQCDVANAKLEVIDHSELKLSAIQRELATTTVKLEGIARTESRLVEIQREMLKLDRGQRHLKSLLTISIGLF